MMKYWIKLYVEILDDPKMAQLPDRLWRRVIELFLLAGKLSNGTGKLPCIKTLAWHLRLDAKDLEFDLIQIAERGIITKIDDGWIINGYHGYMGNIKSQNKENIATKTGGS